MLQSLDPRVKRLPDVDIFSVQPKAPLDQLGTFEVFVEPKPGKPFQHEGSVHAPDIELAYVLAKETFTRRFTCSSLFVCDTRDVHVSTMTDGNTNVLDLLNNQVTNIPPLLRFEVFFLSKRGKQHVHVGNVEARNTEEAMQLSKAWQQHGKIIYNIWVVESSRIRFTSAEEQDLWTTLPEKKFRDAADYKGGDKLKSFLEKQASHE